MMAVGVAKPKLHGHATRHTSTARRTPSAHAPPPWPPPSTPARATGALAGVSPRTAGERAPQKRSVEADAAKTSHVNFPAIVSASRCTGVLRACAAPRDQFPTMWERARRVRHHGIERLLCGLPLCAVHHIRSSDDVRGGAANIHLGWRKVADAPKYDTSMAGAT